MESTENGEVSVMSEVDIAEDLPNGDDSAFSGEDHSQTPPHGGSADGDHGSLGNSDGTLTIATTQSGILPTDHVFVATSQGLLTAEQLHEAGIKTTHIVIHDQTLTPVAVSGDEHSEQLKTPTTPLPPPTPSTPISKEKGYRYQWDDSVHMTVLPVRCKSSNGELHKMKFGSGGRGRCIRMGDNWYTPSEFEAVCGRASSKDWKRSIRYGGRTLQCLIEDNILCPHATSCTCAACCDDETVTGPVRLFVPYKRRKKESESSPPTPLLAKKIRLPSNKSPNMVPKDAMVMSLTPTRGVQQAVTEAGETVQIITTDVSGNIVTGEQTMVMTPVSQVAKPLGPAVANSSVVSLDVLEQKNWWQLEEMANSLIQQAQQLKALVEQAKQQSILSKEAAVNQIRNQMDKDKLDALNAVRIEAQMNLSRAVIEERGQKDIAVQQALAQARAEMQEKMETVTVVGEDKVTYNVTWAPHAGQNNMAAIALDNDGDDSDKEKE